MSGTSRPLDDFVGGGNTHPVSPHSDGWMVACLGAVHLLDRRGPDPREVWLSDRQQHLLGLLVVAPQRGSSTENLLDGLWPNRRPPTARTSLHNLVSRIRQASAREVIETSGDGYRLGVATDLDEARRAINDAQRHLDASAATAALETIDAALALWRGEPFSGLDEMDGVATVRTAAREIQRMLETLRLEALLALGRHGEAAREAEDRVVETPLDERRILVLARSLEALGRRGDALGVIDRSRRRLRAELGVDLGSELRQMESQLLGTGPRVSTPVRLAVRGRADTVQRIVAHVLTGTSVIVVGEPGSGKSSVLREVRRALRRRGRRCALAVAEANSGVATSVLDDLLDELGESRVLAPDAVSEFAAALGEARDDEPIVLIVDDVGLVGPSTLLAFRRAVDHGSAVLVASMGLDESTPSALPAVVPVALEPLPDNVVEQLVFEAEVLGAPLTDDARRAIVRQSGGNPLLLVHLLAEQHATTRDEGPTGQNSTTMGQLGGVVDRLLAPGGAEVRRVMGVAAVIGESGSLPVLEAIVGVRDLERALTAGLLAVSDVDRFQFRHGAMARVILGDVAPGRRMQVQHAVAIESRRLDVPPIAYAAHSRAAAPLDASRAAEDCMAAGHQAIAEGMHRDAAEWFAHAREVVVEHLPADERRILGARIAHGDALRLAGDPRHLVELLSCAEAALALGDPALVASATYALLQLGGTSQPGGEQQMALGYAERALERLEGSEEWALIAAATSLPQSIFGDARLARSRLLAALDREVSPALRRRILPYAYLAFGHPEDLERREATADELALIAAETNDVTTMFSCQHQRWANGLVRGDTDGVRRAQRAMELLAERIATVGARWETLYGASALAIMEGDLDEAEHLAHAAFDVLAPVSLARAQAVLVSQRFAIGLHRGEVAHLAGNLEALLGAQPTVGAWRALAAATLVDADPDRARSLASSAFDAIAPDFTWLAAHHVLGWVANRLADRALAERVLALLAPWAHLHASPATCSFGPVAEIVHLLEQLVASRSR